MIGRRRFVAALATLPPLAFARAAAAHEHKHPLEAERWTLVSIDRVPLDIPPGQPAPYLSFDGGEARKRNPYPGEGHGTFTGFDGCDDIAGDYFFINLHMFMDIATSRPRRCDPRDREVAAQFRKRLFSRIDFMFDEDAETKRYTALRFQSGYGALGFVARR
jgi:hypothetical protein